MHVANGKGQPLLAKLVASLERVWGLKFSWQRHELLAAHMGGNLQCLAANLGVHLYMQVPNVQGDGGVLPAVGDA